MAERGFIERRGSWLLALLWLPAGVAATAVVRFAPESGAATEPDLWLTIVPMMAGSLVLVAPCGLPLALGCRRLWRLGYPLHDLEGARTRELSALTLGQ